MCGGRIDQGRWSSSSPSSSSCCATGPEGEFNGSVYIESEGKLDSRNSSEASCVCVVPRGKRRSSWRPAEHERELLMIDTFVLTFAVCQCRRGVEINHSDQDRTAKIAMRFINIIVVVKGINNGRECRDFGVFFFLLFFLTSHIGEKTQWKGKKATKTPKENIDSGQMKLKHWLWFHPVLKRFFLPWIKTWFYRRLYVW